MWIQLIEYYLSFIGVRERNHVIRMIKQFDHVHFAEVQPCKTYSSSEFRKKIIRIFKMTELTHVNLKEVMSAQQKQDLVSCGVYIGRVQDYVAKAFPKLPDANRQNLTGSMYFQGL